MNPLFRRILHKEIILNKRETQWIQQLYTKFIRELKLRGYADVAIDSNARSKHRASDYFDTCPVDRLSKDDLNHDVTDLLNRKIGFRHQDGEAHQIITRTLADEGFIWALLMQVLPRRIRCLRDYVFFITTPKEAYVYLVFTEFNIATEMATIKPILRCQRCLKETTIVTILPRRIPINFRFMKNITVNA